MSELDLLQAQHQLGEEAKTFLASGIGRLILGRAQQDEEEAKDKFLELDPYQYTTLVELQNAVRSIQAKADHARTLAQYISETIAQGNQAAATLDSEETE